ncbi:MAG: hypothetical protein WA708_20210 [Acidobacteriaceae bacterium]
MTAEFGAESPMLIEATLLQMVLEADEDGLQAGEVPKGRALKNLLRVVNRIRPKAGTILTGPEAPWFVRNTNSLIGQLYRPSDIGMGSLHVGAIMFRDIFARIDIPIGWGKLSLDPLGQSDLNLVQKRWLRSRPEDFAAFCDQFLDLFDFAYGLTDLDSMNLPQEAKNYANLSHFQLEAAAATVTGGCDLRGAIQSSLLGTELVLKAAILALGYPEKELKGSFGHDFAKMLNHLKLKSFLIDQAKILKIVQSFPQLVTNRYSKDQPTRLATGHILMGVQYIASEIMRQLSGRDVRRTSNIRSPRSYP